MKSEVDMAQTFYNSCPSFFLQVLLLIYFPDRRVSWFQYFSIPVSTISILLIATDLFLTKTKNPETKKNRKIHFHPEDRSRNHKIFQKIEGSMTSNFTIIILTIINGYFTIYVIAAFTSIFLPAYFSPFASVEVLEKHLGIFGNTE